MRFLMILSLSFLISLIDLQNINILLGFMVSILAKDIEEFKNDLSLISKNIKSITDDKKMVVRSIIFIRIAFQFFISKIAFDLSDFIMAE